MSGWYYLTDPIGRLHQENAQFLETCRFWQPQPNKQAQTMALARETEGLAMERIQTMGYRVSPTGPHRPFDLWVEGIRVEVKASAWYPSPKGGRYQARIHHFDADVVVFDCMNGSHHFFIIPMAIIIPHKNIAVWNHDPTKYAGQWLPYLEAWEHITEAVQAVCRMWQPPLFAF